MRRCIRKDGGLEQAKGVTGGYPCFQPLRQARFACMTMELLFPVNLYVVIAGLTASCSDDLSPVSHPCLEGLARVARFLRSSRRRHCCLDRRGMMFEALGRIRAIICLVRPQEWRARQVRQRGRYGESRASDPNALAHFSCRQRVTFIFIINNVIDHAVRVRPLTFFFYLRPSCRHCMQGPAFEIASDLAKSLLMS